jgi:hypothetical protein
LLCVIPIAFSLAGSSSAEPFAQLFLHKTVTLTTLGRTAPAGGLYPDKAREAEEAGTAILACQGAADTRLDDCRLVGETPEGRGFGTAAIAVAGALNAGSPTLSASTKGQLAVVPVRFQVKGIAPTTITIPVDGWEKVPDIREMTRAYPHHARDLNQPGFAMLRCNARPDGRLDNCAAPFEIPTGEGFGDAALSLAPKFKLKNEQASAANGKTVDTFVAFQLK